MEATVDREVTVGIIGAGRIGRVHTESINRGVPGVRIKTIADTALNEKIAAWARSMGIEKTSYDADEIFNDPEIDAVLICLFHRQPYRLDCKSSCSGKAYILRETA